MAVPSLALRSFGSVAKEQSGFGQRNCLVERYPRLKLGMEGQIEKCIRMFDFLPQGAVGVLEEMIRNKEVHVSTIYTFRMLIYKAYSHITSIAPKEVCDVLLSKPSFFRMLASRPLSFAKTLREAVESARQSSSSEIPNEELLNKIEEFFRREREKQPLMKAL